MRLSNIPIGVNISILRKKLELLVLPGFYIESLDRGKGVVRFVEDAVKIVKKLEKLKIDDKFADICIEKTDFPRGKAFVKETHLNIDKPEFIGVHKLPTKLTEEDLREATGLDSLVPNKVELRDDGTMAFIFPAKEKETWRNFEKNLNMIVIRKTTDSAIASKRDDPEIGKSRKVDAENEDSESIASIKIIQETFTSEKETVKME